MDYRFFIVEALVVSSSRVRGYVASSNLKVAWMRSAACVFRPDSLIHSSSDSTASYRFLLSAFLYFST